MAYRFLSIHHVENVAVITLKRPDRMNALSNELLSEILSYVDEVERGSAKAILLTGEGRSFSAGADLAGDQTFDVDLGQILEAVYHPLFRRLMAANLPVIAAINGPAVGAGAALALAADISVMARSAYLQFGFVNIGLVPDSGLSWLLTRSVGRVRALELTLLGERVGAQQAHAMGLVTRVADDDACLPDALALAERLASGPAPAMGLIRKQIAAALDADYEAVLSIEKDNQSLAGRSRDFQEGVAAFRDKRAPHFKGD